MTEQRPAAPSEGAPEQREGKAEAMPARRCACGHIPQLMDSHGCRYLKCRCGKQTTFWVSPLLAQTAWEQARHAPPGYGAH